MLAEAGVSAWARFNEEADEYSPLVDVLGNASARDLKERQKRLNRAVDELGVQFSETGRRSAANPWRLDLFPQMFLPDVWRRIEAGVVQRALAFNAYATDIFGPQEILRQRVIPHGIALRDPAFLRPLSGIEVPNGEYSQFGAFDLVETEPGNWKVVEHHMGTPFGLAHVLQNRRILSEVYPELYEQVDAAPVAGFSTFLLEMLRAQSDKINPHVLLLTAGLPGQAYFEEALLARHMGISIAQPGDLIVRDSRVFLRTIRGLEPVDVIYRRIESSGIDPIAVPSATGYGVPGLINVWRKGNVSIVNAPGVGVADNRALLRYDDHIITYYLKQSPILQSVDTYNLADLDQRNYVADREDLLLKPVQDHDIVWQLCGGKRPTAATASLNRIAHKHPDYFVAQRIPESRPLPRYHEGQFEDGAIFLRVYYILGKEPIVLHGGLARHRSSRHRTSRLTLVTDGLKDVIVPDSVVDKSEPKRSPARIGDRFSIGSRVAESLYWAGRYLERAENTARQFETLERLRWDQMASSEQRAYWPLLQAVAAATGQTDVAKKKRPPSDTLPLSRSLLIDPKEGASVRTCIEMARNGLESVREVISPECREVLEEISLYLKSASSVRMSRNRLRELCQRVVSEVARFGGTAERTMPHDDAWQFYRMGCFFERAMGILLLLEVALPRIVENYRDMDEESAELTALLRLLGSLDAYRRTYRSRAYIDRIVELVFTGNSIPSSVSFCLRNLHYAASTLSISGERKLGQSLLQRINHLIENLETISFINERRIDYLDPKLDKDPPGSRELQSELNQWTLHLEAIHDKIEDVFFSHQAAFARSPVLFDIG
ncbi:MAG: circularly permuted type 2 ATP-grasp protein [Verrucomicrobiota bacterium]